MEKIKTIINNMHTIIDGKKQTVRNAPNYLPIADFCSQISSGCNFFANSNSVNSYMKPEDHSRAFELNGDFFSRWFSATYLQHSRDTKICSDEDIKSAKKFFDRECRGSSQQIYKRYAYLNNVLYINMGRNSKIIKIDCDGWSIIDSNSCPVQFIETNSMLSMVEPENCEDINIFRDVVTTKDEKNLALYIGYILQSMFPEHGGYYHMVFSAPANSGKSSMSKLAKMLVDPNDLSDISINSSTSLVDMGIVLSDQHLIIFDNLSSLKTDFSDMFCRVSYGGGTSTRRLYTNNEQCVVKFFNPLIFNGISDVIVRGDLLSRVLNIELKPIESINQLGESEYKEKIKILAPKLLGFLLGRLSRGIKNWRGVELSYKPRLLDAARFMQACLPEYDIGMLLREKNEINNSIAVEGNVIGEKLLTLLRFENGFKGGYSTLLNKLNAIKGEDRINFWPDNPKQMATRVAELGGDIGEFKIVHGYDYHRKIKLIEFIKKS